MARVAEHLELSETEIDGLHVRHRGNRRFCMRLKVAGWETLNPKW